MITIQLKKLIESAIIPTRGTNHAAGHDLYSIESYTLKPLERKLFKTGISIAIPNSLYGRIAPRSGLALKSGIDTMAGVIDSDYRGEICVILINLGTTDKEIMSGDKIAQIIFEHYNAANFTVVTDALPETIRSDGGFGSTDKNIPTTYQPTGSGEVRTGTPPLISGITHGKSLAELYQKDGGVQVKKRYADEIKERPQI